MTVSPPPPGPATTVRAWRRDLIIMVLLLAATSAAFSGVARCSFVNYDDPTYVTDNPHVLTGLTAANFRWAWAPTGYAVNYHPLTWLSLMLDAELARRLAPDHPAPPVPPAVLFHLHNLLLHLLNTVLLFAWLRYLTGSSWRSALVAALFSLHPLRVESVAWVAERKDVLSACWGLLALLIYTLYARTGRASAYALLLVAYAASLLAKPMLVTLPFLLLLLDYWPLRRFARRGRARLRLLLEKIPLLLMAGLSSAITLWAQARGGAIRTSRQIDPAAHFVNVPVAYLRYLGKMAWPDRLAVDYPYPRHLWPLWMVAGSVLVLLAVTGLVVARRRRWPWLSVGWLWYLVALVPVIGFVQVGYQSLADRYTYLPMIGILVALVWSIPARSLDPRWPTLAAAFAGVVLLILGVLTFAQVYFWRNSVTLMTHAVQVEPTSFTAQTNLGIALADDLHEYEASAAHHRAAMMLYPDAGVSHGYYGVSLRRLGDVKDAEAEFRRAIQLDPDLSDAQYNLGLLLWRTGRLPEAVAHLRRAAELQPEDADCQAALAQALAAESRGAVPP